MLLLTQEIHTFNITQQLSSMSRPDAHIHSWMFAGSHACFSKLTTCITSHQQGFNIFFIIIIRKHEIDLIIYPQWCVMRE